VSAAAFAALAAFAVNPAAFVVAPGVAPV